MEAGQGSHSEKRKRFYREAQLASQLDHPHIIKIFEIGEADQWIYISMELLSGQDMKAVLEGSGNVPFDQKRLWMTELAQTFAYAHEKEIIHRDIKPSNVWIRRDWSTVVMDFGIARPPFSDITRAGIIVGTPDYISPEQLLSVRVDQRTDIFLLGILFYELLTGVHPFAAETQAGTAYKLLNEEPPIPHSIRPEIPLSIGDAIVKCLKKDMNYRYQSCHELLNDLQ